MLARIFFVFLVWLILSASDEAVWVFSLTLGLMLELFSVAPFGFILFRIIFSMLAMRWLLWHIITSRSFTVIFIAHAIDLSYKLYCIFSWHSFFSAADHWKIS